MRKAHILEAVVIGGYALFGKGVSAQEIPPLIKNPAYQQSPTTINPQEELNKFIYSQNEMNKYFNQTIVSLGEKVSKLEKTGQSAELKSIKKQLDELTQLQKNYSNIEKDLKELRNKLANPMQYDNLENKVKEIDNKFNEFLKSVLPYSVSKAKQEDDKTTETIENLKKIYNTKFTEIYSVLENLKQTDEIKSKEGQPNANYNETKDIRLLRGGEGSVTTPSVKSKETSVLQSQTEKEKTEEAKKEDELGRKVKNETPDEKQKRIEEAKKKAGADQKVEFIPFVGDAKSKEEKPTSSLDSPKYFSDASSNFSWSNSKAEKALTFFGGAGGVYQSGVNSFGTALNAGVRWEINKNTGIETGIMCNFYPAREEFSKEEKNGQYLETKSTINEINLLGKIGIRLWDFLFDFAIGNKKTAIDETKSTKNKRMEVINLTKNYSEKNSPKVGFGIGYIIRATNELNITPCTTITTNGVNAEISVGINAEISF